MSLLLIVRGPVPQEPPLENAVAPNYERFDGLEEIPQLGITQPLGDAYCLGPAPGQKQTHANIRLGIPGAVGTVGGMPLPVADPTKKAVFNYTKVTPFSNQFRFGPVGQYEGAGETIAAHAIMENIPQAQSINDIFAGNS